MRAFHAAEVESALSWLEAVAALRAALLGGVDPEAEPPRTAHPFGAGQLLAMPASVGSRAGIKLATIVPGNPSHGLPRIHAVYLLFDAATLAPVALLDGTALTSLRTPAVSALGVDLVAPVDACRLIVFGTGPQAYGHVHALAAVRPVKSVGVVGRDPARTAAFVRRLQSEGIAAEVTDSAAVADADLIACCTTARRPLFDGRRLHATAVVVACGSHEPDAREVDAETLRRCGVVVESVAAARAEAGDVVLAMAEGVIRLADLASLAQLVRGETPCRPRLVKTVGMGWEDLVMAGAVVDALAERE